MSKQGPAATLEPARNLVRLDLRKRTLIPSTGSAMDHLTQCVAIGCVLQKASGCMRLPVFQSNTVRFASTSARRSSVPAYPRDLRYGTHGDVIQLHATLMFDVEVFEVNKQLGRLSKSPNSVPSLALSLHV